MSKGRKKIPTKIKAIKGTLRGDRLLSNEMHGNELTTIPTPPDWLGEIAKTEWFNTASNLADLGMLSNLDLGMLASYCNQMSIHIEAEKRLNENGRTLTLKTSDGNIKSVQVSADQKISDKALETALKLAVEFGFTPSARTKISMNHTKQKEDLFEGFTKTG